MIGKPRNRLGWSASFHIWSVNRWLRWTGFRVFITDGDETKIGVGWYGLYGSARWQRIEPEA